MISFIFGLAVFTGITALALGMLYAFAIYNIACYENIELPWLAFIPIANLYLIGSILDSTDLGDLLKKKYSINLSLSLMLPLIYFTAYVLYYVPIINVLAVFIFILLFGIVHYFILKKYATDYMLKFVLGTVLLPIMPVIIFMAAKDLEN